MFFVDLQRVKHIYMTSNLGTFDSTTNTKVLSNVVRVFPVNASYGEQIISSSLEDYEWRSCSKQTLKTMWFKLKNSSGELLELYGSNVTFTIVFDILKL